MPNRLKLISYMVASLVYGGKISNEQDRTLAGRMLDSYMQPAILDDSRAFSLTGLENPVGELAQYMGPGPGSFGSVDSYLTHLSKFPPIDRPEVFGLHPNTQFAILQQEGKEAL